MCATLSGWWYTYPSEKYDFVSWDDDIPKMMGKIQMFQTTSHIYIYIYMYVSFTMICHNHHQRTCGNIEGISTLVITNHRFLQLLTIIHHDLP